MHIFPVFENHYLSHTQNQQINWKEENKGKIRSTLLIYAKTIRKKIYFLECATC